MDVKNENVATITDSSKKVKIKILVGYTQPELGNQTKGIFMLAQGMGSQLFTRSRNGMGFSESFE